MTGTILALPHLAGLGWIPVFAVSGQMPDQYLRLSVFSYISGLLLYLVEGAIIVIWQGRHAPDWFGKHRTFVQSVERGEKEPASSFLVLRCCLQVPEALL